MTLTQVQLLDVASDFKSVFRMFVSEFEAVVSQRQSWAKVFSTATSWNNLKITLKMTLIANGFGEFSGQVMGIHNRVIDLLDFLVRIGA